MATIPPSFLRAIANPKPVTPVTAFLVGRENRRQRERQENQDAQQLLNDQALNELRKAQTEALRRPRAKGGFTPLNAQQKKALGIPPESFAQMGPDGKVSIDDPPSTTPQTVVNVGPGEKEFDKALGKGLGEAVVKRNTEAVKSAETDIVLDRMQLALKSGAQTGTFEEFILTARQAGETLGIADLPADANEQQVLRSLSNRLALIARNPESGLGLPGSTSNRDLDFLLNIVPGLDKSEQGNILIIEATKKLNKLKRDIAEEQNKIIAIARGEGKLPLDLDSQLLEFVDSYSIFTPAEKKIMENAAGTNVSLPDRVFGEDQSDDDVLNEILSR